MGDACSSHLPRYLPTHLPTYLPKNLPNHLPNTSPHLTTYHPPGPRPPTSQPPHLPTTSPNKQPHTTNPNVFVPPYPTCTMNEPPQKKRHLTTEKTGKTGARRRVCLLFGVPFFSFLRSLALSLSLCPRVSRSLRRAVRSLAGSLTLARSFPFLFAGPGRTAGGGARRGEGFFPLRLSLCGFVSGERNAVGIRGRGGGGGGRLGLG